MAPAKPHPTVVRRPTSAAPTATVHRRPTSATPSRPPSDGFTVPIDGSSYPLSLVARGEEPRDSSVKFMGGAMVIVLIAAYGVVVWLVNTGIVGLGFLVEGRPSAWGDYVGLAQSFGTVWGVVGAHLGLASLIVVVWSLFRLVHHRRLTWAWSIWPGVRWRYAVLCLAVSLLVIGGFGLYHWFGSDGWQPIGHWGWYLGVILVTTPLQAIAEEVVFRGYLMQVLGSVVRQVWFPIVTTAVIFALFHGTQNLWLFGSRLIFGLLAGLLVWRTGGLEAGIAIHIVNNWVAFGLAIVTGTLTDVRTTTAVGWSAALGDVMMFVACAVPCWLIGLALRLPTRAKTA